ncbi:hypothetical protein BU26DRAFT_230693 [Trematosphaeria pertusa]|uniref:Uncharacterized protein n=1 Tax=Trematosphaeria pertusa TaxID=390896 RepID=A0A6A6IUP5_9PLEO|nr:uncharacterized protein BU26DRAFT_230693 [Trematosphaeria pertusa]KAF2253847.1 hypothetical protein BU26DRAFT_230693 [Trematosphaeria pertusa]
MADGALVLCRPWQARAALGRGWRSHGGCAGHSEEAGGLWEPLTCDGRGLLQPGAIGLEVYPVLIGLDRACAIRVSSTCDIAANNSSDAHSETIYRNNVCCEASTRRCREKRAVCSCMGNHGSRTPPAEDPCRHPIKSLILLTLSSSMAQ